VLPTLDDLIFLPDREVSAPPPGVEERWLTATDGTRLHAWWACPAGARARLLWSHGNAGNIASRADVLTALAARGLAVLAYDYRGYGRSGGRPSEAGVHRDAEGAYASLLAAGVPAGRIVAFGESLGGAVAIRLAVERPCAGVAVVATFTNMRDVARHHYGPLGLLAGRRFDSTALLPRLRVPLLVVHGERDEIVPVALGEALFALAPEPKRFLHVPGAHHNDVLAHPAALDAIAAFAASVAARG
jgi:hypothetical protein